MSQGLQDIIESISPEEKYNFLTVPRNSDPESNNKVLEIQKLGTNLKIQAKTSAIFMVEGITFKINIVNPPNPPKKKFIQKEATTADSFLEKIKLKQ